MIYEVITTDQADSDLRGIYEYIAFGLLSPDNAAELTEAELNAELEKGYADMVEGRTKPARQAFADIRKDYGI